MSAREAILALTAGSLLVAAVTKRPSKSRWLFFPAILATAAPLYSSKDLPPELVSILLLFASDYILLTEVQQELSLVDQEKPVSNESLWIRLIWSLRLLTNMRGINWKHEPKHSLPPRPRYNRVQFIISRTLWAVTYLLLFDFGLEQLKVNPAFRRDTPGLGSSEWSWAWRFWTMVELAVAADSMLALALNIVPSLVCVATGLSKPEDWIHLFGSFIIMVVPTVHKVWGYSWHQLLRRPFLSHGKFVAHRLLGLAPGTDASHFTQIMVSFFISGAMHTRSLTDFGAMKFFLVQGAYIIVENLVLRMFANTAIARWNMFWRIVGNIWLWTFCILTIPLFFDTLVDTGYFDQLADAPELGLVRWLVGLVPMRR